MPQPVSFVRKVYFNNKPIILTSNARDYLSSHAIAGGYEHYVGSFPRHFRLAVQHLLRPTTLGAIIEDDSPDALLAELHRLYTPIDAGGGVVTNERDEVLLIYRRGKWDLPKGKRDDGESMSACALREVTEETGLQELVLGHFICETYHVYAQRGEQLLKRTAWYAMNASSTETLRPQAEENILEARWVARANLGPILFNSYTAIRHVIDLAGLRS